MPRLSRPKGGNRGKSLSKIERREPGELLDVSYAIDPNGKIIQQRYAWNRNIGSNYPMDRAGRLTTEAREDGFLTLEEAYKQDPDKAVKAKFDEFVAYQVAGDQRFPESRIPWMPRKGDPKHKKLEAELEAKTKLHADEDQPEYVRRRAQLRCDQLRKILAKIELIAAEKDTPKHMPYPVDRLPWEVIVRRDGVAEHQSQVFDLDDDLGIQAAPKKRGRRTHATAPTAQD